MKTAHTATPFVLHEDGRSILDQSMETLLASAHHQDGYANGKANAAFIVTACNAHDGLVHLLKGILMRGNEDMDVLDEIAVALENIGAL